MGRSVASVASYTSCIVYSTRSAAHCTHTTSCTHLLEVHISDYIVVGPIYLTLHPRYRVVNFSLDGEEVVQNSRPPIVCIYS